MVNLTHPKNPLSSLHIFSTMNNKLSSSLTNMKIKTLIHNLIFSHICRVIRAVSKAKPMYLRQSKRKNKYRNKILFGSFRLHYNWCSSSDHVNVLPISSPILIDSQTSHIYYDSSWNSVYSTDTRNPDNDGVDGQVYNVGEEDDEESELSSYLQWLEEKGVNQDEIKHENEIDKLADLFIARCHEKFLSEKIESCRRYQELLARSL